MKEFDKLIEVIEKLRDKENGCPWDLKQTHESLIPNFIEELYESVEAIENKDYQHLSEELGDLMNLTRERIRQIEATALRKLRSPNVSYKLEDYVE